MNGRAYTSWATATAGLLALTYGLERTFDNRHDRTAMAISGLAVPVALAGLGYWTAALVRDANR